MRPPRRLSFALVVTATLVVGVGAVSGAVPRRGPLPVTGYAGTWSSPSVVLRQAAALSSVGVDGVDLLGSGANVSAPSARALALLQAAHAHGLGAELLVDNYDVRTGAMSATLAGKLLESPRRRARVVAQLVHLVHVEGWNGVTVDLESLQFAEGPGLFEFVRSLHRALPGRQVAVDVSAVAAATEYPALGYRLTALSKVALVVLMAYDEDGPWSGPGPIGGLPWQRAAIAEARVEVPASRLVLGVAAYGFSWPKGPRLHQGETLGDAQARALVIADHRVARWVPTEGEYTATLSNGTVLWWSDARSFRRRVALARHLGLAGLAVWQLGTADVLPAR